LLLLLLLPIYGKSADKAYRFNVFQLLLLLLLFPLRFLLRFMIGLMLFPSVFPSLESIYLYR
jgi:hypothetical protein